MWTVTIGDVWLAFKDYLSPMFLLFYWIRPKYVEYMYMYQHRARWPCW